MTPAKSPLYWQQAKTELAAVDSRLAEVISQYPGEGMQGRGDAFHTLLRSVTGQQISVKAADAIWGRLEKQLLVVSGQWSDNKADRCVVPEALRMLSEEDLRAIGYSRQKVSYLHSLADFFHTRQHLERDWAGMSDEEVIKDLIQIKGIGRWTAEMFLIFHLQRPDVFPVDDLGLLKAIRLHYSDNEGGLAPNASLPPPLCASPCSVEWKKSDYVGLAESWRPWRSVATWYLWRSLDPVPVEY